MHNLFKRGLYLLRSEGIAKFSKRFILFLSRQFPITDRLLFEYSKKIISIRMQEEKNHSLNDIIDTLYDKTPGIFPYHLGIIQIPEEIQKLAETVKGNKPQIIVEIGTNHGGTLYIWSRYFDEVRQIVSIDLPEGGYPEIKQQIYKKFPQSGEINFILADSHQQTTLHKLDDILKGNVDFLFIDADHTYEGVKQDFEMYSQLVSDGGIVAFHDIVNNYNHPNIQVYKFWAEIKTQYEHEEIISNSDQGWGGIGLLYM